jgi:Uma2 family endonuclease
MSAAIAHDDRLRRWTRVEYERIVDAGVLTSEDHVELIDGEILMMGPEKSRHTAAIDLAADALRRAFGPGYTVRIQHPLAIGPRSEPEPDLAIVPGSPRDYADAHPSTALLVVEVADASLAHDRTVKAASYAVAGIRELWIVNVPEGCLEVHRDPEPQGYRSIERLSPGDRVTPLAAPGACILVADLVL